MKHFLPPHCFLTCLTAGLVLHEFYPLLIVIPSPWNLMGVMVLLTGVGFLTIGSGRFIKVGTNLNTFIDPNTLVIDGPFRITRNPMYLGFTLVLTGTSFLLGSLSAFVGALLFYLVANYWYIPFEEARCMDIFGGDYVSYRERVRRWL